jgi:Mrp family chromosome partitioning ATPase
LPNPSELIESGSLDELIEYLKSEYEYIIIDTSPVGLVVDALQLMRYASQILLVARINYTRKDILENVVNDFNSNKIKNYDIIFNSLSLNSSPYKKYSSYYIRKKDL